MQIDLELGRLDYVDTGGDGPTLVFVHGLLMDLTLWDSVIADLSPDHRCIAITLPLGAHCHPQQRTDRNLTVRAVAGLIAEFLERFDLSDVTLIGNDTGGAIVQLLAAEGSARIGRIVLVSCDAFENYPPGLTGTALVLAGRLPSGLFGVFLQQLRLRPVRRLPIAFGWLTKYGDAATRRWLQPALTTPAIRRDLRCVLRSIKAEPDMLMRVAEQLNSFDRPALVVWARGDRVMPLAHGARLAELLPQGSLTEIADSASLIPLDQPATLARQIREFRRERTNSATGARSGARHA